VKPCLSHLAVVGETYSRSFKVRFFFCKSLMPIQFPIHSLLEALARAHGDFVSWAFPVGRQRWDRWPRTEILLQSFYRFLLPAATSNCTFLEKRAGQWFLHLHDAGWGFKKIIGLAELSFLILWRGRHSFCPHSKSFPFPYKKIAFLTISPSCPVRSWMASGSQSPWLHK